MKIITTEKSKFNATSVPSIKLQLKSMLKLIQKPKS
jgi:hypothetical protein